MRKRREMGLFIMLIIIAVCLFLIFTMRGSLFAPKSADNVSNVLDKDISVADSLAVPTEEAEKESMNDLTFLVNNLSFERRGSQILIAVVAGLLILYLIIIGPVTYFYLKRIRKMERMWLILPAVSILFGCIILLMSNDFIIREPFVDVIKVIKPGEQTVCYGVATSPGEESYSLYFKDTVKSLQPWVASDNYRINEERRSLTLRPSYAFEKSYFQFHIMEAQPNNFVHNIHISDYVGTGMIYNTTGYSYTHLMLCYEDNYCIITGMNPGDEYQVEADMWKKYEYGMIGSLKEELQMQSGLTIDEKEIFNFAWYQHMNDDAGQLHITAVSQEGDAGMNDSGVNLISYSLFYQ